MNEFSTDSKTENIQSVQIIIDCKDFDQKQKLLEKVITIKYSLPMIHSYVAEIKKEHLDLLEQMQLPFRFEIDELITAQMKRAGDLIGLSFARKRGISGKGVGVAVVDTGVSLHPDLIQDKNRIIAFQDFIHGRTKPYDDNGHGTHVSGIIGGNGSSSNGLYTGVAPECDIIGVKVLDRKGNGNTSDVLAGLQWIIDNKDTYHIRVVNISVGTTSKDRIDENSLLVRGVNAVWDAGLVVVVAAGNNGPRPMSISTPGISRKVITVGASDDNIAIEMFGSRLTDYSGRGPTNACIKKPDIVAPGSNIVSCNLVSDSRSSLAKRCKNLYTVKSGTSMSTPIVSGAIALLLSSEPNLTNRDVKLRLKYSGTDLGYPQNKQGWGMLNIEKLLSAPY